MRAGARDRRFVGMPRGRTDLGDDIPRYPVQRALPDRLQVPVAGDAAELCASVIKQHAEKAMAWVRSYVSDARRSSFCVDDAPAPGAIRRAAGRNKLAVKHITAHQDDNVFTLTQRTLGAIPGTSAAAERSPAARAAHRRRFCSSAEETQYAARLGARLAERLAGRLLSGRAG